MTRTLSPAFASSAMASLQNRISRSFDALEGSLGANSNKSSNNRNDVFFHEGAAASGGGVKKSNSVDLGDTEHIVPAPESPDDDDDGFCPEVVVGPVIESATAPALPNDDDGFLLGDLNRLEAGRGDDEPRRDDVVVRASIISDVGNKNHHNVRKSSMSRMDSRRLTSHVTKDVLKHWACFSTFALVTIGIVYLMLK